jgi:hypothetical protein
MIFYRITHAESSDELCVVSAENRQNRGLSREGSDMGSLKSDVYFGLFSKIGNKERKSESVPSQ